MMALTKAGLSDEIYRVLSADCLDDNGRTKLTEMSDKLAEAIVTHVVESFGDEVKNTLLERFDNLESDFDSFVQAMTTVGLGTATIVPTVVLAWIPTSNTGERVTQKAQQEAIEKPYTHGSK